MSRKLRPLAALATVALIGGGGSYSLAANDNTAAKGSSSLAPGALPPRGSSGSKGSLAPGTLPSMGSSGSTRSLSAPGTLPPMESSGLTGSLSAPGTLPPMGSSR